MEIRSQVTLRAKKLGVLIRDARQAGRRSIDECARAMGITKGVLRSYEEGERAPSLPELEVLAYYLNLPIDHFWGTESISGEPGPTEPLDLPRLIELRQRMIGALLRSNRNAANMSVKALALETGVPTGRINAYELGERPVPLPELEVLLSAMGGKVEAFLDQSGPIGQWMVEQKATQEFLELPKDLQTFVCQPVNRPYIELAMKISAMSSEKLRSVAEGLLDITL